jgi:hypothetical protein
VGRKYRGHTTIYRLCFSKDVRYTITQDIRTNTLEKETRIDLGYQILEPAEQMKLGQKDGTPDSQP